jgi:GH15 family glucan-1,4-alpha-glucosidase
MGLRIEDYALIGDTQTAGLVGKDGSLDWLCLPRFDSGACFSALLGGPENGRWKIAPKGPVRKVTRRYLEGSMVLETEFRTEEGVVRLYDFMPPRDRTPDVARVVVGVRGRVTMEMELVVRSDYGSIVPWVRRIEDRLEMIAGPDAFSFRTPIQTEGRGLTTVAEFAVERGQKVPFLLSWHPSCDPAPPPRQVIDDLDDAVRWWREWTCQCRFEGRYREIVQRSLLTLKALTYAPTGGIVAAPTTSLPEWLGGVRNWDYRYCWLRDATLTLFALINAGFIDEARSWRDWLLRAVAGDPSQLQIMYGPAGDRRLTEWEVPWLSGYEGSAPVRVGNAAVNQFQLDVYGEVIDALHQSRRHGLPPSHDAWALQRKLLEFLEGAWNRPDEGIWEVRGPRRHFTHSKVLAWVAFDRAVQTVQNYGMEGPLDRWRAMRDAIHREVCEKAWDSERNTFVQSYGSKALDASLLQMALVGFLPPSDPRIAGTVEAIERELMVNGFVLRYSTEDANVDGLPPGEGAFLPCSFWLADNFSLLGRRRDAVRLFDRLRGLCNDVGLLSEEYDPVRKRMLGNFPQAFTHVALINTAQNLTMARGPARERHGASQRNGMRPLREPESDPIQPG